MGIKALTASRLLRRGASVGAAWLASLVLLAGCATGGYGAPSAGYPPGGYPDSYAGAQVVGTVERVEPGLIVLRDDRSGGIVQLGYDRATRLFYQGQELSVQGLERGDGIRVDTVRGDRGLWARNIEVVRNVRDGYGQGGYGPDGYGPGDYGPGGYGPGDYGQGGYGAGDYANTAEVYGTVAYLDPRAGMLEIEVAPRAGGYPAGPHGYASRERVRYDYNTLVEYRGQRYRPEDLERGDLVRVQADRRGSEWLARRVIVERSVRERR